MRRLSATQRDGKWMRLRAVLLAAAMLALFGIVLVRAAKVQLLDRSRLSRLQRDQTRRELEWVPRRGMIVDRRGEPLAVTRDVDSVFADPSAFETPRAREAVAAQLAGALRLDRRKIAEKLAQSDRRFVWIKRRIDEASARRVRGLALDGIELVKEPKRFYPQRELAGHVLGFVGDESGQEGLERELETFLKGTAVQVQATRDARGTMVLEHGAPDPADLTGATVTLTLDTAIQLAAEKELAKAVKTSGAVGGWAIAMDVNSGAVLALAGNPAFDANKPGRDPLIWRDRAIQDQLEPGSTIKSFVVARAIDEGALRSDEILYCEHGAWARAGKKIHDTHPVDWATPATVLRESSNICAAKIGERLGKQKLIDGLRAFGFGEKTGVGLPGEARGALADPKRMPQIALWTTSFGQGMSATAIQTVAAMAAIANGGVLLRPYLVQKVVGADGTVLLSRGREEVRRVLKEESAREVTAMLEEVVEKGTGTRAALVGHRAAGKTGTAQKVDPVAGGYGEGKGADVTGGTVAAPAWAAIAHEALRQLDVMPDDARVDAPVLVSSLAGSADPEPAPEEAARMPLRPGQAMVPDVSGMGARTATRRLAQAALEPELRGSGRAVAQSPRAGAIVKRGARVKVTLAPPG